MFYGGSEFSAIFPLIVACFITDIVAAACYPCCLYICSCVASCLDAVRSRACPFFLFELRCVCAILYCCSRRACSPRPHSVPVIPSRSVSCALCDRNYGLSWLLFCNVLQKLIFVSVSTPDAHCRHFVSQYKMGSNGTENGEFEFASPNGLAKISTKAAPREVCKDDTTAPVKAQNVEELHALQKKKASAPSTPQNPSTPRSGTPRTYMSEEDRQKQQLQSIRY